MPGQVRSFLSDVKPGATVDLCERVMATSSQSKYSTLEKGMSLGLKVIVSYVFREEGLCETAHLYWLLGRRSL
jgi:hypothetical protein